jgi:hypothetical protein
VSQLTQVLESLNKIMSKEPQSFAKPHHPSRINFPLHQAWPTITIKHHPLGIKVQRPLCSMPMHPQVVLPRLSFANLGLHPSLFAHMAHSAAHLRVFRYSSDGSVISFFATGSLSPKPFRSSELLRRRVAFNHVLKSTLYAWPAQSAVGKVRTKKMLRRLQRILPHHT